MMRRGARDAAGSTRALKDQVVERGRRMRDDATQRVDAAVSALAGNGDTKLER
jgi:hypothetical protein